MEFILRNIDIFDDNIDGKFNHVILSHKDNFIHGKVYKLSISFNVNLLNHQRFEESNAHVQSKTSKSTNKDKIYDLLDYQLKTVEQVLSDNGIIAYSTVIQGEYLETENIIKIEIKEDNNEHSYSGKPKNRRQLKIRSIVPNLPFTQETANKLAEESLSRIYLDLMKIIRNKKIMSQILMIESTEDDNQLFKAFAKQYWDLWLATGERKKELLSKFQERSVLVLEDYCNKHKLPKS